MKSYSRGVTPNVGM